MRRLLFPMALASALAAVITPATSGPAHAAGAPAPPFTVKGLDGRTLRLSDFKGKPVVLDFWATWCVPCRATLPHLSELQERHRDQGLVVLGLSVDDDNPQEVRRFADRLQARFRIALADDRVLNLYGPIRSIPTTFFINRRGEVVRRVVGYIDGETIESYAQELFQP